MPAGRRLGQHRAVWRTPGVRHGGISHALNKADAYSASIALSKWLFLPTRPSVLDPSRRGVTYNTMANSRTARIRASKFRDRQRAKGLRPATIWIPDIRDPAYRARLDAACRELAALPPAEAEADAAAGLADAFKYMSGWQ